MPQRPGSGADWLKKEPVRVVLDPTGPPVLNQAAAEVLLRILLRAAERHVMTNATHPSGRPVRSDS